MVKFLCIKQLFNTLPSISSWLKFSSGHESSTQVKTTWRMCIEMENNGRVIWTFCINVLPPAKKKMELALLFLWQWKIALRIWKLLLFPWVFILSMPVWKAFWKVYSTLNTWQVTETKTQSKYVCLQNLCFSPYSTLPLITIKCWHLFCPARL